jgi:hypothetical protein
VIRVEKEALRAGVYEMLSNRIRRATKYVPFCLSVPAGADNGLSLQLRHGRRRLGALGPRSDTYLPPCADRTCPYCCARRRRVEGHRHDSPLKISLLNVHARYILYPREKLVIDCLFVQTKDGLKLSRIEDIREYRPRLLSERWQQNRSLQLGTPTRWSNFPTPLYETWTFCQSAATVICVGGRCSSYSQLRSWQDLCRVQHRQSRWGYDERRSDPERDFHIKGITLWETGRFGMVIGHCSVGGGTVGLPGYTAITFKTPEDARLTGKSTQCGDRAWTRTSSGCATVTPRLPFY